MSRIATDLRILTRSILVIAVVVCVYACYLAQDVLVPLVLGMLLALLLSPVVSLFERMRIPRALGSLIMVLLIVGGVIEAVSKLAQPAQAWVADAPATFQSMENRLRHLRAPFKKVREAGEKLEHLAQPSAGGQVVIKQEPSVLSDVVAGTPHALAQTAIVLLLVYFFLSAGDTFLRRLVEVSPGLREKKVVVGIARGIQQEMSRYLITVAMINLGVGVATTVAVFLLGVPNALLWGALAGVLNFAPYIGPTVTLITLALVGLTTFSSLGHALAVPGAFFAIALLEGQLISPIVIGRRLAINPVVVFVWLLLWGALWGISGVLLAGPLLACFRILCQNLPSLQAAAVVMGDVREEPVEREEPAREETIAVGPAPAPKVLEAETSSMSAIKGK